MIKNRTSTVPVERTVARIESVLSRAGVTSIHKTYGPNGEIDSLMFTVEKHTIRLPVRADAVTDSLRSRIKRPRKSTLAGLRKQAERTAWKLMQDWVEVQISLIELQQAEFLQVFLPYVWDVRARITFYDMLRGSNFKALPELAGAGVGAE
jgi:hypothetical protein